MATMQSVIVRTRELNRNELALVQSRFDIENPVVVHKAVWKKPNGRQSQGML